MAEVIVLAGGYARTIDKYKMAADATCCLVKSSDEIVLVDTLGPWNADKLINLINKAGFHLEDITYVVCTHSHADHLGNLNLFTNKTRSMANAITNQLADSSITEEDNLSNDKQKASKIKKHIVGNIIYYDDQFEDSYDLFKDKVFKINEHIQVRETPGHTSTCVSVLVDNVANKGRIAIAGDLFEMEADLESEYLWLRSSENIDQQKENRQFILDNYDYIVPGHGPMFFNKKRTQN